MRTVYTTIKISQPQYDVELFRFYRTGVGRQLYLKQSSITQNDSTATVRYHYDGACRIDSLRLGKDVVKAMSYNANGWLTRSSVSGPMLIKFPPVDPDLPVLPRPGQAKAVAHKGNIFNETLHYADAAAVGAPRYDGKISVRNCDNALTAYAYDCHGRLITSTSYSYRGSATSADFSTEYAYDRNANLLNVTRNGIIDNVRGIRTYGINNDISMTYSANRLKSVTVTAEGADYEGRTGLPQFQSSGVDFTYDPNGNMISDAVRGITDIRYNRLNLPVRLTFADGHRQTIAYDGFGRKTKIDYAQGPETIFGGDLPAEQDYVITSSRVYAGPHIFADGQLEYSAFDGGYFNADGSPCYYITDWQGNNAAVVNSAGSIIQSAAYYPYGEPTVEPKGQRFLFGGKEREHAGGRNAYDFGARSLTPYGSWPSPDPKAEDFYQISPFSYCAGDPINFIDPTGENIAVILQYGSIGHMALLVQDEEGIWKYFSLNGDKIYNSSSGLNGVPTNDVGTGGWSSPQEFIDQAHKTTKEERKQNQEEINNFDYTEAYEIETTPEQDKKIAEKFAELVADEDYNLVSNNCAIVVQRCLRDNGLLPDATGSVLFVPTNTGAYFNIEKPHGIVKRPNDAYNYIKKVNPNGTVYKKRK